MKESMKVLLTQSPEYIVFSINPDPLQTGQDEVGCEGFQISGGNDQVIKMMSISNLKMSYMDRGSNIYHSFHPIRTSFVAKEIKGKVTLCFYFYFRTYK